MLSCMERYVICGRMRQIMKDDKRNQIMILSGGKIMFKKLKVKIDEYFFK